MVKAEHRQAYQVLSEIWPAEVDYFQWEREKYGEREVLRKRNGREVKGRDRDMYVEVVEAEVSGISGFFKDFSYRGISKWKKRLKVWK